MEDLRLGTIEVYGEADWKLGNISELKSALNNYWKFKIEYDQKSNGYESGCVFHAGMGCISDQIGQYFTQEDFDEVGKLAPTYGRAEGVGMYVYKGVDLVRNWFNKKYKDLYGELSTLSVGLNSKDFKTVLDKGYSVHTGYKGNYAYNQDVNDNCVLEGNSFGETTYGHSIRITKKDDKIYVVDNYCNRKECNVYKIEEFEELIKNGVFFNMGYIYMFKTPKMNVNTIEHIKPEQAKNPEDREIILAWEQEIQTATNWKLLYNNYIDNYDRVLHRYMIEIALIRYEKNTGK